MKKLALSVLAVSVAMFAHAVGTWGSSTGGDVTNPANYSDGEPVDRIVFCKTQSAPVTASRDVSIATIQFHSEYYPFVGDIDLGAGRSLVATGEFSLQSRAKVRLTSGILGIPLDAAATRQVEFGRDLGDGNELVIDGPDSRFTTPLGKGMFAVRYNQHNLFKICNGASFEGVIQHAFMNASASNNLILATDPGTTFTIPTGHSSGDLRWGESGSFNEFCVSNSAWLGQLSAAPVYIGIANGSSPAGTANKLKVADKAVMDMRSTLNVGWSGAGSNALEVVDSATLYMTNANPLNVGGSANTFGNRVILARGGKLVMSGLGGFNIGNNNTDRGSEMRIESGAEFRTLDNNARCYCIGKAGTGAKLVIDGGTFYAPNGSLDQAPYGNNPSGSSVEVLNGGVINVKGFNSGSAGSGHSLVVSNGYITTSSSATFRLGVDGGRGSVLTIAGTNSQINCYGSSSFKGGCTINFNVPAEGFKRTPFYVNSTLQFVDATTINVTVDNEFIYNASRAERRVLLIKSPNAFDLGNVTFNLSEGLRLDTSVTGELAVVCPPGRGTLLLFK
ncbi:MAG: hypothetical protein IKE55_12770 [Kiritimatiellae bacterium]|nr:hypothetical protein [Kiritimatiellia bacterium]